MNKKYIVRLTDEERAACVATIKKETGKSEKLRRATILLKADADGAGVGGRQDQRGDRLSDADGRERAAGLRPRRLRGCASWDNRRNVPVHWEVSTAYLTIGYD